jgi:hypothetical protein
MYQSFPDQYPNHYEQSSKAHQKMLAKLISLIAKGPMQASKHFDKPRFPAYHPIQIEDVAFDTV